MNLFRHHLRTIALLPIYIMLICFVQNTIGKDQKADPIVNQNNKRNTSFEIYTSTEKAAIVYNKEGSSLDSISAYLLAEDIYRATGCKLKVSKGIQNKKQNLIVIGELGSDFISGFLKSTAVNQQFKNQKESYLHKVIKDPNTSKKVFVIAGTDPRGTAYGVFEISKKIGVSPWYWWADAPVKKKEELILDINNFHSKAPSVEFRGIFLNDEDWGLQPWAAKTFEPEVGDIGPKTYAKIFELLLRLKANTIWPAMHPSTKAFFHYPGNPKMARLYHIVVGSSHAEPMLRNNVDEWDKKSMGSFNYLTNKQNVVNYWEERVKEARKLDAVYTLGMRGIHDSGMEGVDGIEEATANLQNVINDQRDMLTKYNHKALEEIPQVFTVYKEVLNLYDYGLDLPEDITIMWTDDNYGYIRRLSNKEERKRKGGSGVYYHTSYWGRPHDYQWLNSTPPTVIWSEMKKAYATGSKKIWVLNVGDLKPSEYNIDLFMNMAYNMEAFQTSETVNSHMTSFYSSIFGETGADIAQLKSQYYNLAFERKPEFMGWSQTEPTTPIDTTAYTPFAWGDEINSRINSYQKLENKVKLLQSQINSEAKDAFFQLVYYPVKGASYMNKKFLYRDLAIKYASQGRLAADQFKELSSSYYDSIMNITAQYNNDISNRKWKHIMSMAPRDLPVFHKPEIILPESSHDEIIAGISVEQASNKELYELPVFYKQLPRTHFIDLFLKKPQETNWKISSSPDFLNVNTTKGTLTRSKSMQRIHVSIDWKKWQDNKTPKEASFTVQIGKESYPINLHIKSLILPNTDDNIFIPDNEIVVIYAENYSHKTNKGELAWEKISGLGHSGNVMLASPVTEMPIDTLQLDENAPVLTYDIFIDEIPKKRASLILNALPTHPITNKHSVRLGVQWNNGPIKIVDFRTYGRSDQWKQNVLKNTATEEIPISIKNKGKNSLKLYMIDQGVAVDYMYLNLDEQKIPYSLLPETKL